MATIDNRKISDFSENTSPSGDNILPIVASGSTDYITLSGLTNYIYSTNVITFDVDSSGSTVDVSTSNKHTFVKINNLIDGSINFTCSSTTLSQIADTLTLNLTYSGNNAYMVFDDNFYITFCGGTPEGNVVTLRNPGSRNMTVFTFDGEKWMCTYDNC